MVEKNVACASFDDSSQNWNLILKKKITSNHEEYSNAITLEKLKFSGKIYWGATYICRKSNKETWGN